MSVPSEHAPTSPDLSTIGVVLLTQGTRPDDLAAGIDSLLAQRGVRLDIVCVGNGWQPTGLPSEVRALGLPTFEVAGVTLLKRLTLALRDGAVTRVWYPVFPPDTHAAQVLAALRSGV